MNIELFLHTLCLRIFRQILTLMKITKKLLGRLVPIFSFKCELFLIVTLKNKEKKIPDFIKKKFADFQDLNFFYKNKRTFKHKVLIINKPSLGSCEVPHKIWARSVQPFGGLLETNKQTDMTPRQATFIHSI